MQINTTYPTIIQRFPRSLKTVTLAFLVCLAAGPVGAQTYRILHHFGTNASGTWPHGAMVQGGDGYFYGVAQGGGLGNHGQVYRMGAEPGACTPIKDFSGPDGSDPEAALLLQGNTLFGTTYSGGVSNLGTIFRVDTDGGNFAVLKHFEGNDGASSYAALVAVGTTLYGTTRGGGISNCGVIFRLGTNGSDYQVIKQFTQNDGGGPGAGLCLAGNALYGTTVRGGAYNGGTVFKVNLDGSGYEVLEDLPADSCPESALVLSGTTLYGTTILGGSAQRGTVFSIGVDGIGFKILKEFGADEGGWPNADLVVADGRLYGRTYWGGSFGRGVVFELTTDGVAYSVLRHFAPGEGSAGGSPGRVGWRAGLLMTDAGLLVTCPEGGEGGLGTVCSLNTDGSGFAVLKQFTGGDGIQPYSGVAKGPDGTLYGTTYAGGSYDAGTLFRINADGTGYATLREFAGVDGRAPEAGVLIDGATLYSTTCYGGVSNRGTLFKIGTDGTGYSVIWAFSSYDEGVFPRTIPVLSGTTLHMGINYGKLFRINTDGTSPSSLIIDAFGGYPESVLLSGSTLFGVHDGSTSSQYGDMIYRVNTDGSGFAVLTVLGGIAGSRPNGPLALSGNTLYGTAYGGGAHNQGTVFKVNTDGTGFAVLRQFAGGNDGCYPSAGVVVIGDILYGSTGRGGPSNAGLLFSMNRDGTGFAVLRYFSGGDGRLPSGSLVVSGTNLFGTTMNGGTFDQGVVFVQSVPAVSPVIRALFANQTAEVGAAVHFSVDAGGALPMTYEWFFDGTNSLGASTNRSLWVSNVQLTQAGAYHVAAANAFGTATSSPVVLNVITPVLRRAVPVLEFLDGVGVELNIECTDTFSPTPTWLPLDTVTLTSPLVRYFDLTSPLPAERFYRARQTAASGITPVLRLPCTIPALTLTGSVGSNVRVDGINQVGPVDAWFTLDTVTLTNTTQFFFDTTAPGQPARLYRLVPVP